MATINVPADQATIALGIAAASAVTNDVVLVAAGTYIVSGVVLNKAITLRTTAGAIIQASSSGNGTGVEITSDGAILEGFRIENFEQGIGVDPGDLTGFDNVEIRDNHTVQCQYHIWITGNDWVVELNEFERCRRWVSGGDSDYGRMFGTGHIYQDNYCHGTNIPADLAPGPDYAHTDCLQTYTQNGEVFQNIIIRRNFFTDFVQGLFIGEEFTNPAAVANVEVYDNVFWGTTFTETGNLLGVPSHGIFFGKETVAAGIEIYNNIVYQTANAISIDYQNGSNDALVQNNYIFDYGTLYNTNGAHIDFGTGNIEGGGGWPGAFGTNAVDVNDDVADFTDIDDPLGLDGIPFTEDDGWLLDTHDTFGPQIAFGADETPPIITLTGSATMNWNQSQGAWVDPGYTAIDNVDGDITGNVVVAGDTVDVDTPGPYVITYNVSDAALNAATEVTRTVTVVDNIVPVITRLGDAVVNLAIDDPYTDDGATAEDNVDGDITAEIITTGDVIDTSSAGVHTVRYNVEDAAGNAAVEVTRTVNVLDDEVPVITLVGPAMVAQGISSQYVDQGVTAADNIDGNITANVIFTNRVIQGVPGTYINAWNVTDSSGNAATEVTRTVQLVDDIIPVITLLGSPSMVIEVGDTFTDPGFTALDTTDGDLSADVVVTGTVNENVAGLYTLRYNVVDASGNAAAEKVRTVEVQISPDNLPLPSRNSLTGGSFFWGLVTKG